MEQKNSALYQTADSLLRTRLGVQALRDAASTLGHEIRLNVGNATMDAYQILADTLDHLDAIKAREQLEQQAELDGLNITLKPVAKKCGCGSNCHR